MSDQPDTYAWMTAPAHLMTRRQLRAADLRPNGQDPVAVMVGKRRGRRLTALLYDSRTAAPKRRATPAQLVAIAKAIHAHQLAAAVRRGITEDQLTTAGDPGTAWTTTMVAEKGNTMSDNQTTRTEPTAESLAAEEARYLVEQIARAERDTATPGLFVGQTDSAPVRAVGPAEGVSWIAEQARTALHTHLVESRHLLGEHPDWKHRYDDIDDAAVLSTKVPPVGHAQRTAHLHAIVAVNQGRYRRERRAREHAIAVGEGQTSVDELNELTTEQAAAAQERLSQPIRWANRDQVALTLADALSWRGELEVADDVVTKLVGTYAADWGVIVNPDKGTVRIDPNHDAAERQVFDEVAVVWDRESAVIDIVSASGLDPEMKGPVMEAIHRWRAEIDYHDPQRHIDDQAQRREQLRTELAELPIPADARAYIDVTVDYLRGDVADVDLLNTPVSVDPGEEARGRMRELLGLYAGGDISSAGMATEIAVMTPEDQQLVREIGRGIRDGNKPDLGVWPDYINRDQFTDTLHRHLHDAEEQRAEADYIVDQVHYNPAELGVNDDIETRLHRMAATHETLHDTVRNGRGLVSTERHQLTAVLAEIETGRILTSDKLPELLFLDERTKSEVDNLREDAVVAAAIGHLPTEVSERVTASTKIEPDNPVHRVITTASEKLHDTVTSVASVSSGRTIEQNRELFTAQRNALGKALGRAGVDRETMGEIRTLVDTNAKSAAETRSMLTQRREQWSARTEQTVAARDEAAARNAAEAKGGQARACRTRTDRTAAPAPDPVPAPAPASTVATGRGMGR
ncbi:RRQRL motif-containing zinc-binding protein [Nocardia salmonicida]|uniref:RRQRL motif-containing zinc-binding protein n=1 Tax=Nocardia salmonicida TaxID=53431 RepID=UPI0037AC7D04